MYGEQQVEDREDDKNPGDKGIAGDFVWPRGIRFFAAENEDAIGAGGVEDPAYKNQSIGQRVECAAEEEENAPDALDDQRSSRSAKARMRFAEDGGEDTPV